MRADEILAVVEARVRRANLRSRTVYRREWSIGVGATRVDLAVINGRIAGYEVKSARDNFGRLAGQVSRYNTVLDEAVLVVEGAGPAARASSLVPPWWGIWLAERNPRGIELHSARAPGSNPRPQPCAVAQLLWRDEAFATLDRYGRSGGLRRATRWRLWERLAAELPLATLQNEVRESIKARPGW